MNTTDTDLLADVIHRAAHSLSPDQYQRVTAGLSEQRLARILSRPGPDRLRGMRPLSQRAGYIGKLADVIESLPPEEAAGPQQLAPPMLTLRAELSVLEALERVMERAVRTVAGMSYPTPYTLTKALHEAVRDVRAQVDAEQEAAGSEP